MAYLLVAAAIPVSIASYYKLRNYFSTAHVTPNQDRELKVIQSISTQKDLKFSKIEPFHSKNNLEFLRQNSKYKNMKDFTQQGGIKTLNSVTTVIKNENISLKKFP